jgi:AcrR family transcriptional regulator
MSRKQNSAVLSGTKENIIAAAKQLFAQKGKYGATMEEIALTAGINKAMVYYYFSNRQNLYREVLLSVMNDLYGGFDELLDENVIKQDPVKAIRIVASAHIKSLSSHRDSAHLVFQALANEPDELTAVMEILKTDRPEDSEPFMRVINEGKKKNIFRNVEAKQVFISFMGMNMVFFVSKSIAKAFLGDEIEDEEKFSKGREESIIDLLLNGIVT